LAIKFLFFWGIAPKKDNGFFLNKKSKAFETKKAETKKALQKKQSFFCKAFFVSNLIFVRLFEKTQGQCFKVIF